MTIKKTSGQSWIHYFILVSLFFPIVTGFLKIPHGSIPSIAFILWIILVSCGCLGVWSEYHKELKAEGLASGTWKKKVKFVAGGVAFALGLGIILFFLTVFVAMANSFKEMKLENFVTQSPLWSFEKPEIYADDARIELRIRFPLGILSLVALDGKTWKRQLQQIPPEFEKYLPILTWRRVKEPDPFGQQMNFEPIPFGSSTGSATCRMFYCGAAPFQKPVQVKTFRVCQSDAKGDFFVLEEDTEFIIPILGFE
jgi:hypothetical protein